MVQYKGNNGDELRVEVVVNRKAIREYEDNEGQTWVEGREGSEWCLRIRNFSDNRFLAVVSCDGLDVLTGQPATIKNNGYIVPAHDKIEIKGWRLNSEQVAKFRFGKTGKSYAVTSGVDVEAKNVGVIGVALYREKEPSMSPIYVPYPGTYPRTFYPSYPSYPWNVPFTYPQPYPEITWTNLNLGCSSLTANTDNSTTISSACSATPLSNTTSVGVSAVKQDIGTEFGKQIDDRVISVDFSTKDTPDKIITIFYDSLENLKKRGIIKSVKIGRPNPFPGVGCKPPKGWTA
jgi:hypothetical protein